MFQLQVDLTFLASHVTFLSPSTARLGTPGLPTCDDSIPGVEQGKTQLEWIPPEKGDVILEISGKVMDRNSGLEFLRMIAGMACWREPAVFSLREGPYEVDKLKFCNCVSVDVERKEKKIYLQKYSVP